MSATNELNYASGYSTKSYFKEIQASLNPPLAIQQTSGSDARFVIPAGVYNWSKAHIDLDIVIGASAANSIDALHLGKNMLINSINLQYDGAPNALVNIGQARVVSCCTTLPQLKFSDYVSRPIHHQNITANAGILERGEIFAPIKHASYTSYIADGTEAGVVGTDYADLAGMGGYSIEVDQSPNGSLGAVLRASPIPGDTAPATAIGKFANGQPTCYVKLRINLSDYKNTIFAQDKTIYYPINATLLINFAQYNQWGFTITGNAGAPVSPQLFTTADLTSANVALANPAVLWVPYENNPVIASQCRMITSEGLSMRMPYVSVLPAGGSASAGTRAAPASSIQRYNCPLSQTYGNSILRIYTVVVRTDGGIVRGSNCNTVNPAIGVATINNLYGSVRSFMGQTELQQGTLNCLNGEDYRTLKTMLAGSAITSQTVFQAFSFWVDNFTNSGPSYMWDAQNSDVGSYDMIDPMTGMPKNEVYSVELSCNFNQSAVYFIIVGQKMLYVRPGEVNCTAV